MIEAFAAVLAVLLVAQSGVLLLLLVRGRDLVRSNEALMRELDVLRTAACLDGADIHWRPGGKE